MLAFLMAPQKVPLPWTRGPDEVAPVRNGFPLPAEAASLSIRGLQQQPFYNNDIDLTTCLSWFSALALWLQPIQETFE
jgi:hypothetical protein